MFPDDLVAHAQRVLEGARSKGVKIATAESCTGGLLAGVLTEVAGASDVFERGFVTYSNAAKIGMLGVAFDLLRTHGAVSAEVARAMAEGALRASAADVAISITGVAGPGQSERKPVGLVYIGFAGHGAGAHGTSPGSREYRFGDGARSEIRRKSVAEALGLLSELIGSCG